jgi:hypothetical protein
VPTGLSGQRPVPKGSSHLREVRERSGLCATSQINIPLGGIHLHQGHWREMTHGFAPLSITAGVLGAMLCRYDAK